MLLGLSWSAWLVIVVALIAFAVLALTDVAPAWVFYLIMAVLSISPVMGFEQAFAGFDSSSVLLVGVLFVVIAGLKYSGALDWMVRHLMGLPRTYVRALLRLMIPVTLLSSVMSNTTTTALFRAVVQRWAVQLKISPSKLLIPLAYAATIGGLLTLIGTPPNLIIASLYTAKTGIALNLFAPLPVAVCCIVVDILLVLALRRFLPERECPQVTVSNRLCDENGQEIGTLHQPQWRTYLSLGILVAMLTVSAFNLKAFPLASCALVAGILMVFFRCCTPAQALQEVDWKVIIIFAGSVGLGAAVEVTGIGTAIVNLLIRCCDGNPMWVVVAICLVAGLLTEFISDTACGAMLFPVAWQASTALGVNPLPLMIALMMSASSSFVTPIATPPNMLVYQDGGYRFTDYARLGLPMKVAHIATAIIATMLIYPL